MPPIRTILAFVGLGIAVSIAFGLLHDSFSVAVCEPYLRDYHPHTGLTGIGLVFYWGFMATWWVGAIGGLFLGLAASLGKWPTIEAASMRKFLIVGSAILLVVAIAFWFGLYQFAERARETVTARYGAEEFELRRRLVVTASMHALSYAGSVLLILAACAKVLLRRRRLAREESVPVA